ncbi:MAG: protein kinase, partial [Victivallales bacterium]|nr:protein kinase [Victivallales bacterium]
MARILEQNDTVTAVTKRDRAGQPARHSSLVITSDSAISRGQVTLCYQALHDASRREIFLKQFKQPSPHVDWYKGYIEYLDKLVMRINGTPCKFLTSRIFGVFEYRNSLFEAMELMHGRTLGHFLKERSFSGLTPLEYKVRLQIAVCFMGALKALHDAGIVHTDLKPENIFLENAPGTNYGFSVKLIDLDYAIMEDVDALPWKDAPSQAIAGTPGYFPPERYTGEKYGRHSDIFTAAIILQELLCSQTPFPKDDYDRMVNPTIKSQAPAPPVFPAFVHPQVAAGMAAVLSQCLLPDKSSRPSAERLHAVLRQFQSAVASGKRPVAVPQPPPIRKRLGNVIVLQGPSGAMVFNDTTDISSAQLRNIDSSAADISDRICQFTLQLEGDDFFLLPNLSANSDVYVNDIPAESRLPLKKG